MHNIHDTWATSKCTCNMMCWTGCYKFLFRESCSIISFQGAKGWGPVPCHCHESGPSVQQGVWFTVTLRSLVSGVCVWHGAVLPVGWHHLPEQIQTHFLEAANRGLLDSAGRSEAAWRATFQAHWGSEVSGFSPGCQWTRSAAPAGMGLPPTKTQKKPSEGAHLEKTKRWLCQQHSGGRFGQGGT